MEDELTRAKMEFDVDDEEDYVDNDLWTFWLLFADDFGVYYLFIYET